VCRYRLSRDGRKWRLIARERMALAEWLATHGDADGSRIWPAVASIMRHFGWSHGKTFYLLKDLKDLGLLESSGLTSERGTRVRRMNLAAFLGAGVQDSPGAGVQDSRPEQESKIREQESNVTLDTTVTLTDTGPGGGFEVGSLKGGGFEAGSLKGGRRGESSSSAFPADDELAPHPDWVPIERKTERLIEEARTTLIRDRWPAYVVDAGLSVIEERSDFSGTVPASANYFVCSFNSAMADHCDKTKILKRAEQRERFIGCTETEIRRRADEIKRESEASGRPSKEIVEERLRARVAAGGA
jgi:hypothetical protein